MTDLCVLRALDKQDRLGLEAVLELLTAGRRDESGDVTPGCGLSNAQAGTLMATLNAIEARFNPNNVMAAVVHKRISMMYRLEETMADAGTGRTAWDVFLDMGPFENIGWALDDLVEIYQRV